MTVTVMLGLDLTWQGRGSFIGRAIEIRQSRVEAKDIPDTGRDVWLFEQWRETDRWISERIAARGGS